MLKHLFNFKSINQFPINTVTDFYFFFFSVASNALYKNNLSELSHAWVL